MSETRYRALIHKSRRFKNLWHIDYTDVVTSQFKHTDCTSSWKGALAIARAELGRLNRA